MSDPAGRALNWFLTILIVFSIAVSVMLGWILAWVFS